MERNSDINYPISPQEGMEERFLNLKHASFQRNYLILDTRTCTRTQARRSQM